MEFIFRQDVRAGTSYRMMHHGCLMITANCQASRLIMFLSVAEDKQIITSATSIISI